MGVYYLSAKMKLEDTKKEINTPAPVEEVKTEPAAANSDEIEVEVTMDDIKDMFKSEDDKMSREDFITLCEKLDYNDILRNPDNYNSKYATIEGQVDQIIESMFDTVSIFIKDANGNIWGCTYKYSNGESRILENDNIKIYGKCYGTQQATNLAGKQVILPYVDIKYFDMKNR